MIAGRRPSTPWARSLIASARDLLAREPGFQLGGDGAPEVEPLPRPGAPSLVQLEPRDLQRLRLAVATAKQLQHRRHACVARTSSPCRSKPPLPVLRRPAACLGGRPRPQSHTELVVAYLRTGHHSKVVANGKASRLPLRREVFERVLPRRWSRVGRRSTSGPDQVRLDKGQAIAEKRAREAPNSRSVAIWIAAAPVALALAGFLIPLAPFVDRFTGTALWAGALGMLGTIGGMSAAEAFMARLDRRRRAGDLSRPVA